MTDTPKPTLIERMLQVQTDRATLPASYEPDTALAIAAMRFGAAIDRLSELLLDPEQPQGTPAQEAWLMEAEQACTLLWAASTLPTITDDERQGAYECLRDMGSVLLAQAMLDDPIELCSLVEWNRATLAEED